MTRATRIQNPFEIVASSICQPLPYTSDVEVRRNFALTRFARPSMFLVPMTLVLMVFTGLNLSQGPALVPPQLNNTARS